ncbi:MAG: hypothetical protein H6502_02525 [Candidatus Woesearchaeota archaeon]|nr:MAG: hypothetical protein H6502_02525 [Candidatus Woesearchaeota archaeon]
MHEKNIKTILAILIRALQNKQLVWCLEGSANLLLQGVEVSVQDLDITTNNEGIAQFRTALKKYLVKDFFSEKINGHSLICSIDGCEVEINSYGDRKLNMFDKTEMITWNNLSVPILPLRYAKQFYESIGREEKVALISRYL